MWYASTGLWSECAKIFCQIKHAKLSKYSHDKAIQFHDNSNDSWKVECETVPWTDSTNYNHTFCQWWLLAVIKKLQPSFHSFGTVVKVFANRLQYLALTWKPFMLLALCEGNPLVINGFPSQKTSSTGFDIFFDVSLNKLLNKHPSSWLFHSLWHTCESVCTSIAISLLYRPVIRMCQNILSNKTCKIVKV